MESLALGDITNFLNLYELYLHDVFIVSRIYVGSGNIARRKG